ncbi:MAG: glycosyltransferase family 4 protein [Candidatus Acidiferrales bacterium]
MNSNQQQDSEGSRSGDSSAARGDTRTRVLTVLPDFPFPATTGLHLRMVSNLELVRRLGCYSALLYFSTEDREPAPVESTPLAQICDEVRHGGRRFPHRDFSASSLIAHKVDFLVRGALGMPGKSYPFSMSYDRIRAADRILADAQRLQVDFVAIPSMLMHYTPALREHGYGVIIDAADVLSNLSASFLKNLNGRAGKLGLVANYLACRSQERIFLKKCTEVWATSSDEASEFQRIAPGARIVVVPNSLDEREILPSAPVYAPVIGFIGTYSYTPNLQAAKFLAEQVFPRVLDHFPNAALRIAGAHMPDDVAAKFGTMKNVEMLGRVVDSGRFMDECAVLALPVFIRGGVPLKLIEAMARGKAIVATRELVDGLGLVDGKDVLIHGQPQEFAGAIVSLLRDEGLRQRLGAAARATFVRDFSLSSTETLLRRESVIARQ